MTHAIMVAHGLAVVLFLLAAFKLRGAAKSAFKRELTPLEAMQVPMFFACLDIAYNLTVYRLFDTSFFMLIGACLHCVVATFTIMSTRAVKSWR